jgi:hypothetical protein
MNKLVTAVRSFWSAIVRIAEAGPGVKAAATAARRIIAEKAEDIIGVIAAFTKYYEGMALLVVETARAITSVADALKAIPAKAKALGDDLDAAVKKLVPTPQRVKRAYKKTGKFSKRRNTIVTTHAAPAPRSSSASSPVCVAGDCLGCDKAETCKGVRV